MLPVPGPGFRVQFWTCFGRKPDASGPKTGPKLPGPKARVIWDRFWVGLQPKPVQNRPLLPQNPLGKVEGFAPTKFKWVLREEGAVWTPGPEALLSNLK